MPGKILDKTLKQPELTSFQTMNDIYQTMWL